MEIFLAKMQHCAGSPVWTTASGARRLVSSRSEAAGCTYTGFTGCVCSQRRMIWSRGSSGNVPRRGLHIGRLLRPFSRSLLFDSGLSTVCSTAKSQVPVSAMETVEMSSEEEDEDFEVFDGLGGPDNPVGLCETRTLAGSLTLEDAMASLEAALNSLRSDPPPSGSGVLRIQVPLPPDVKALQWLQSQPLSSRLLPRSYFSPRLPRGDGSGDSEFTDLDKNPLRGIAGVGSAVLFKGQKAFSLQDWTTLRRYLSPGSPLVRAYGGLRFNPDAEPSIEWKSFGSFYFLIPQVEFCECETCSLLAVTVAWDVKLGWTVLQAIGNAFSALHKVSCSLVVETSKLTDVVKNKEHVPNERSWHRAVTDILAILQASDAEDKDGDAIPLMHRRLLDPPFLDKMKLSKVVMARRTMLEIENTVNPLLLLATLQEKDPSAYQFCIQIPDGTAFVGSTPERLFVRNGPLVASEAVAATRARGSTRAKDLHTAMNLLLSKKDHHEFEIVRESVKRHLQMVCKRVDVESHKETIKQARVQHLYSRLNGELKSESGEFDLLSLLHPTPAVCGHPQEPARLHIASTEEFDRGMYAGPVGWIGGGGAEFCVGIRSALVKPLGEHHPTKKSTSVKFLNVSENGSVGTFQSVNGASNGSQRQTCVYLYAGVGVVKDSKPESEWQELELKISQFETLFKPALPLEEELNINYVWAKLIVEECCRLGVTYFCIAPGSRSSPLTAAAAANPQATCVTCIDERSLAFYALGYGKGANKPAAIITSSGTAVSNLLPAVVEACQDFVPILLLTADRPSEMHDSGANQTIDQDKHFGGFVRYHVNLPPPVDNIAARFVLTTIDAAVFRASAEPLGAVHINCQFREPLAGTKEPWNPACLRGLERWVSSRSPFTKYMTSKPGLFVGGFPSLNAELKGVADILKGAKKGLIIAGGLQVTAETWAVALLAHHLGWPVVPDVVSGLRLGRTSYAGNEDVQNVEKLVVVHNFDHMLLSNSVFDSFRPDVVLQIGGRLTSKRLANFLEQCYPRAYILVEDHNFRQDPSHILTHRIQWSAVEFSSMIKEALSPGKVTAYAEWLQELSEMCGREIRSQLNEEVSLKEPQIAQMVAASLPVGAGLFLGNSMAIRDMDMYGETLLEHPGKVRPDMQTKIVPDFGTRVAANRGASGIDGVLSTAIGFAVGSNRRVTLLIGDVSFLHDTNGLTLIKPRSGQPPITVVVVNNSGGGIFSMLPIATTVPAQTFRDLWETSHDVGIGKLCLAHSVGHMLVETKKELDDALHFAQRSRLSWVVEVKSSINENTQFHRLLASRVFQEVTRAHGILLQLKAESATRILDFDIHRYSFPLRAPPTTRLKNDDCVREGFFVRLTLSNGASGVGEVAPLPGLHRENLLVVEEQLRLVAFAMKGVRVGRTLCLLNGGIAAWFLEGVGIEPKDLFPSVRSGLEMAILDALAQSRGCSMYSLLMGTETPADGSHTSASRSVRDVRICALLEAEGTVEDIVETAHKYVQQGYCTLKIKVARRENPCIDAAIVKSIREKVGPHVVLRADANRKWSYNQAVEFAREARNYHLQYLEEPLVNMEEVSKFCVETGMAVALDESIDEVDLEQLPTCFPKGVVALIIKPGRIGGFERAASIARLGRRQGIVSVISSAFESSISLSAYAQFAAYLDARRCETEEQQESCIQSSDLAFAPLAGDIAHGLGTFAWLPNNTKDIMMASFTVERTNRGVVSCVPDAPAASENGFSTSSWDRKLHVGNCRSYIRKVVRGSTAYNFSVLDTACDVPHDGTEQRITLFFLHGFLGNGQDWLPVMDALSASFRCIAVDLIGHGLTTVEEIAPDENGWSMDSLAGSLSELLVSLHATNVVLVGYSMGGRVALHQAMRHSNQVIAAVIVSGSPGLVDSDSGAVRAAQDDELAETMLAGGIEKFVDFWYSKPLWESLRARPYFQELKRKRKEQHDMKALAKSLRSLSIGRQESLWQEVGNCCVPLLCVVGELDPKFVNIAHGMQDAHRAGSGCGSEDDNSYSAWMDVDRPTSQSARKAGRLLDTLDDSLVEGPKENLSAERQNFLASVQKTIRSWGLEDDHGFADFVAEEVRKWEQEAEEEGGQGETLSCRDNTPSWKGGSGVGILEVDGSGHSVHVENPLVFVREVRNFVQSLGASVE